MPSLQSRGHLLQYVTERSTEVKLRIALLAALRRQRALGACRLSSQLGFEVEFNGVLVAVTADSAARLWLISPCWTTVSATLDHSEPAPFPALRARAKLLVLSEAAATQHSRIFLDAGART